MWVLMSALASAQEQSQVHKQLSVRDKPPSCTELAKQHENLVEELHGLIHQDITPSYVPMRAASCLLELQPLQVDVYRHWMIDPHSKGLAYLVVSTMPDLPVESAVFLARAGLEGVHSESLKIRLERLEIPEVHQAIQDIQLQEKK